MARRHRTSYAGLAGVALLAATSAIGATAFSSIKAPTGAGLAAAKTRPHLSSTLYLARSDSDDISEAQASASHVVRNVVAAAALASAVAFIPALDGPANAYDPSDYASETVTAAVTSLKEAEGDASKSFEAFEEIAAIIAEGKGIGGSVNYNGVQLERGYIADEDTTIYNPGLTLLTESEKDRLVEALVKNRKAGLEKKAWSNDNELGFAELKSKLDPLFMWELRGYLKILPYYGAAVYLATFFVQQNLRQVFPVAYIIGAIAVFGPIAGLIAAGP
jgi:hypothetical protein